MPLLPSSLPPAPPLARLLAELPLPVARVVCTGGVTLRRGPAGAWGVATETVAAAPMPAPTPAPMPAPAAPSTAPEDAMLAATLRALGLRPADLVGGMTMLVTPPWGSRAIGEGAPTPPVAPRALPDWRWTPVDPDALARREDVRPVVLTTEDADRPAEGSAYLVSAAGTLGWRPPLDTLCDLPGLAGHALRLRFVVDLAEQRALAAALRYARAAEAARGTAALLDARELTTLAVTPSLFIEVDALLGAAMETMDAVARLVEDAFGVASEARSGRPPAREPGPRGRRTFEARVLRARGAPPELRDALLGIWDAHGAVGAGHRRAVRRAAAAELGPPTVRVHRLESGAWSVRLPIASEPAGVGAGGAGRRRRQDAFGLAWTFATEAWRAATLAIYAAVQG